MKIGRENYKAGLKILLSLLIILIIVLSMNLYLHHRPPIFY